MYTGPNIIEDGLVFGYDADDRSTRFYPGEPTVNLTSTNSSYSKNAILMGQSPISISCGGNGWSWCQYGGNYSFNHINTINPYGNTTLVGNLVNTSNGGDYRMQIYVDGSTLNRTFTFSMWIKNNGGTLTTFQLAASTNGDSNYGLYQNITLTNEWQHIQSTFTFTGTCTDSIRIYLFGAFTGTNFLLYESQLEEKSHATQFVNGERTNTNSLIDLKKSTSINLSNVSFDSTAHPVFDGTNDFIDLGNYLNSLGSAATFECVFKASLISNVYKVILGWGYGTTMYGGISIGDYTGEYSDESLAFTINGNLGDKMIFHVREGVTKYADNNYHHVVVTSGQNSYKIYIDGIEKTITFQHGSQSSNYTQIIGYNGNVNFYIGKRPYTGSEGYFNGYIPVVKIYNKILTSSEIQQNFNSYKSKFSI